MDRLTDKDTGILISDISRAGKNMDCKEETGIYSKELLEAAIDRLAEYEDIGTPQELAAIKAENEQLKQREKKLYELCYKRAELTPDCNPYYCVDKLKSRNEQLKADNERLKAKIENTKQANEMSFERLRELNTITSLIPIDRLKEICEAERKKEVVIMPLHKELDECAWIADNMEIETGEFCGYFVSYPTENIRVTELQFLNKKGKPAKFSYPQNAINNTFFVGENARERAEARLKEIRGEGE